MGHAVLAHLTSQLPSSAPKVVVDSAGTGAYHTLSPPDRRTMTTLKSHGITGFSHAARMVAATDYTEFDYILAMDGENLADLKRKRNNAKKKGSLKSDSGAEVMLFGEWDPKVREGKRGGGSGFHGEEVEDPYYGGNEGFEIAFDQCVRFSQGWIQEVLGYEVNIDSKGKVTAREVEEEGQDAAADKENEEAS